VFTHPGYERLVRFHNLDFWRPFLSCNCFLQPWNFNLHLWVFKSNPNIPFGALFSLPLFLAFFTFISSVGCLQAWVVLWFCCCNFVFHPLVVGNPNRVSMGSGGMVAAAEALAASGRSAEKLSLSSLQSKMKCDPEGYESELLLIYNQFNSSLELFQRQAAMNFTSVTGIGSDPTIAKDLGDRAMFLSHVTPFYPKHLADFPRKLADLLRCAARTLPSGLRCQLTHALILLSNRKV